MLKITNYVKAESLQQAYELNQKKSNMIIAGMLWTKMMSKNVSTAIDISGLGLDKIVETDSEIKIGAMVTLRDLETSELLDKYSNGALKEALQHIVGVQFRNMATVGGSIFGRYGFSDVYAILLALDGKVELFNGGVITLSEFAKCKYDRDILVNVIIPKKEIKVVYKSLRNSSTDFPVVNCAVSYFDDCYHVCIGARPGIAKMQIADKDTDNKEFGLMMAKKFVFGSNNRGSAAYRKAMAAVLIERCLEQLGGK